MSLHRKGMRGLCNRGMICLLLIALLLPMASVSARRIHDLPSATSSRRERTASAFAFQADAIVPIDLAYQGIMGQPMATREQCVEYLLEHNPCPLIGVSARQLVDYYYDEGGREGVRPDVAFAQAIKETGFFSYGGIVTPDQNNYCGLGTTSRYVKGEYFATPLEGVRAHIQHLLAYASTRLPEEDLIDPRYMKVRTMYGLATVDNWTDLNGRWAVPGTWYGQSIMELFGEIVATAVG